MPSMPSGCSLTTVYREPGCTGTVGSNAPSPCQGADARKVRTGRWLADRGVIRVFADPRDLPFTGRPLDGLRKGTASLSQFRHRLDGNADQDRHAIRAKLDGHEVLQRLEGAVAVHAAAVVELNTRTRLAEALVLCCFIHACCAGVRWRKITVLVGVLLRVRMVWPTARRRQGGVSGGRRMGAARGGVSSVA